jgi:hypothetical protein
MIVVYLRAEGIGDAGQLAGEVVAVAQCVRTQTAASRATGGFPLV